MADQAKITDYFRAARRPTRSESRKRKVIEPSSLAVEMDLPSSPTPTKRDRLMFIPRSRRMVEMAQKMSPAKSKTVNNGTTDKTDDNVKSVARNLTEKLDNARDDLPQTAEQTDNRPPDTNGNKDTKATEQEPKKTVMDREKVPMLSPLKFQMENPIYTKSPIKSPLHSPVKRDRPVPLYQRFSSLIDDEAATLTLPKKYKLLADTFSCLDRVVSLVMKQKQQPTFERVKSSVEMMSGRRFDMKKLMQIKTVFPDAFTLKYESSVSDKQSMSHLTTALTIVPTRKRDSSNTELMHVELKPSVITSRKHEMYRKLVEITKVRHGKFLESLDNMIRVDNRKLAKWHPNFPLDEVPDIEPDHTHMPSNPNKKGEQTVDVVLTRIANEGTKDQVTVTAVPAAGQTTCKAGERIKSGLLKGLDMAFVERIRANEAKRMAKELTRSPETEKKIAMLQESSHLIRTIRNHFVSEGKTTLPKEQVVRKLVDSYSSYVSKEEVDERLTYLTTVLPAWIMIFEIRKGCYVKILNRNRTLVDLEQVIEQKVSSLREEVAS